MAPRTQRGHIFKASGHWYVRYRDSVIESGQIRRVQVARQLAPVCAEYKTKASVRSLADEELAKVNPGSASKPVLPTMTISEFADSVYFPMAETNMRPSTLKGYRDIWRLHIKPRCGERRFRDFDTPDAQQIIDAIAGAQLSKETLKHIKSFLSGMFAHAKRKGLLRGRPNPIQGTQIPKNAPKGKPTAAYELAHSLRIIGLLPSPADTVIATAALAGLRKGEIRGLRWEDYSGEALFVRSSVWQKHVTEAKTESSVAPVPVIDLLRGILDNHHLRSGKPKTGLMFQSSAGTPMDLDNLANRVIRPTIERCVHCRRPEGLHAKADHSFELDPAAPRWLGWHAFRRGLATSLYHLGVPAKTVQAIMRHANVDVTMKHYVQSVDAESIAAMSKLQAQAAQLCSQRAMLPANHPQES